MIYDHINNLARYIKPEIFKKISSFLQKLPSEDGKYNIDGDNLFAIISTYNPRKFEDGRYETHFKYVDLQLMVSGSESIWYCQPNKLMRESVDIEKDITFYQKSDQGVELPITTEMFMLIFTDEGHLPSVGSNPDQKLRKVVFKIMAQMLH